MIEFTVANYRSIAEPQTFSMSASKRSETTLSTNSSAIEHVVSAACMFGPNGSGKSNLIDAMRSAQMIVQKSFGGWGRKSKLPYQPHRLCPKLSMSPTSFGFVFLFKGEIYDYAFSLDADRIWSESLYARSAKPRARERLLFERHYKKDSAYQWEIGDSVSGQKEFLKRSTNENQLFLSVAANHNSEELSPPHEWIAYYLRIIGRVNEFIDSVTCNHLNDPEDADHVVRFLRSTGVAVNGISAQKFTFESPEEVVDHSGARGAPISFHDLHADDTGKITKYDVDFELATRDGSVVRLPIEGESTGTRMLFKLAGPWIETISMGYCLVVDELQNSLHPTALRAVVSVFMDSSINTNGAQIIFTSHDSSILSGQILERDQVWFCDKLENGSSVYYPLTNFAPRKGSLFQRNYLAGRYGAVPRTMQFERELFEEHQRAFDFSDTNDTPPQK